MNCKHCGKKLPLLRKFNGGEFCSEAHRAAYSSEADRLALRRLIETPGAPLRSVTAAPKHKGFKQRLEERNGTPPSFHQMLQLPNDTVAQHGSNVLLGSVAELTPMGQELALGYFRGAKPRARLWLPASTATTQGLATSRIALAHRAVLEPPEMECLATPNAPICILHVDEVNWVAWSAELAEAERKADEGPGYAGLMALDGALASLGQLPRGRAKQSMVEEELAMAGARLPRLRFSTSSPEAVTATPAPEPSRQLRVRPASATTRSEPPVAGLTQLASVAARAGRMSGKLALAELPKVLGLRPTWPARLELRATGSGMPLAGNAPLLAFGQARGAFRLRVPLVADPVFSVEPVAPGLSRATGGLPPAGEVTIPLPAVRGAHSWIAIDAVQPLPAACLLEAPASVPLRAPQLDPPLSALRTMGILARNPLAARRPALVDQLEAVEYEPEITRYPALAAPGQGEPQLACLMDNPSLASTGTTNANQGELDVISAQQAAPAISSAQGGRAVALGIGMNRAARMFPLPADRLLARDCHRRPKDQLEPEPPKGYLILSSARLKIRMDAESSLVRLRRWMPEMPDLGNLPKWGAGLVMTLALCVFLFSGAPKASGNITPTEPSAWANLQKTILNRAAVALTDDFRAGLGDWTGREGWGKSWSFDSTGFARTGTLALYSPSVGLHDYRFEFLGQIEKKALSWVVRAADLENYQVVRLELSSNGPLPRGVIVRYPVIDGRKGSVTRTDLPMPVTTDTVYRVAMEVHGADHTLMVQGQVVDSWTEKRLKRGGIGFFSAASERARLRWIGVWHQYDTLGRLCAYLVPRPLGSDE